MTRDTERDERLAAALRVNLRRRKVQAREGAASAKQPPERAGADADAAEGEA